MKYHEFIICFYIIFLNSIFTFKPDNTKNDITGIRAKDNPKYKKDCKIKEKCRECTFDELKFNKECQNTGFKLIKLCSFYDDQKLMDEEYFNESCPKNKTNSVYIFLIICIIIGAISFYVRQNHKNLLLSKTMEKLTIFRKKA